MSFSQAFIYLLAAVISVPLAKRLGWWSRDICWRES